MVKFFLGVVSGGLLVTGGLVVSSMLFPTQHANDNAGVTPAVEESISAPAPAATEAGAAKPAVAGAKASSDADDGAELKTDDKEEAEVAEAAPAEAEPKTAETAAAEPVAAAPATETATAEPAPTDATTSAEAETAPATPDAAEKTPAAETASTDTAAPAAAAEADAAPAAEPVADAAAPAPEAEKPVVADALPAPAAPQVEGTLADAGAPAAAEVAAPATAAEPSKPADAVADAAAVAPDPAPTVAPADTVTADAGKPAPAPAEPAPAPAEPAATEAAPTETATAEPAPPPAAPEAAPATEPTNTEVAEAAPAETQPITETPAATEPATEPAPATAAPAEEPAAVEDAPAAEELAPEVMPAAPVAPEPEVKLADATPGQDVPDMPGTKPAGLPEAQVEMITPDTPIVEGNGPTFKPAPGLTAKSDGVVIKRGNAAEPAPAESDAAAAPPADTRPIAAYATKFENPEAKPPFAIVLIDDGRADLDRAGLAALPLPVSVALDPLDPATPERAASYRAAGKEVVMLVTGIAQGAQASDVEVAFQSMAQGLPEAVAALDLPQPAFQNNRGLASAVVPILKAQGRGLLTWDAGLNAADQVARREDLEAAVVFRDLDQAKGDRAGMRRLLDRAVFKAGQEGRVAVVGTADADMLTGLLEWSVEGKAATVAVAPLTAVLKVD